MYFLIEYTGIDCINQFDSSDKFSNYLYFSYTTWTTLGYGDVNPTESCRLITSFQATIGYVFMAIIAGIFLSAWTKVT